MMPEYDCADAHNKEETMENISEENNQHTVAHIAKMLYEINATTAWVVRWYSGKTTVYIDGGEICEICNPENPPTKHNEIEAGIGNLVVAIGMISATLNTETPPPSIIFVNECGKLFVYPVSAEEFEHIGEPYMIVNGERVY